MRRPLRVGSRGGPVLITGGAGFIGTNVAARLLDAGRRVRIFDNLSFTHRTEYVRWVLSAKRAATRERRVAEAPALLRGGRRTPLG